MDRKQVILSYQDEVHKLRGKINQLEVDSVEQRASSEVRQWRQKFDANSSSQVEKVINELEERKLAKVHHLANELRTSLDEFKKKKLGRLADLDAFISKINLDDDVQLDYIKFELDTIAKKLESLHIDIVVETHDVSSRRHPSTTLARNTIELVKIFGFKNPESASSSSSGYLDPLTDFVRRASLTGASYYNVDGFIPEKHF